MKKSMFLFLFALLVLLSSCSIAKTQTLEEFYKDAKIENVDKAIIQDGSTGYSKTITKQEQIGELLNLIKDIKFTPQDNQEERTGWRYGLALFDGEKEFIFTLSKIENTYYDSNPDIYPIVENYYEQLDIEEK
ncbi:hypothetical protein B1B04_12220 [Lysinibacillus sp. KCTC 33748]|uniref:hypothetical protein n=1 Tax=unclassified Lysinibacillus TaxID=2636778 RepID=UPI0009A8C947|nr:MULTISPECIES: hypothetical protein [unclassified Lysinibacillus]OXS73484.1 hypothetical protein B1B04_12220 [Lysinibacillus sp. KCTC 33748]SKB78627.1 hypothetical protein SAMN06295926_10844 [Lysinibacillus sp. AC-3]